MTVVCWSMVRGKICGGLLTWTKVDGRWSGRCGKCEVQRRAASGEKLELDSRTEP